MMHSSLPIPLLLLAMLLAVAGGAARPDVPSAARARMAGAGARQRPMGGSAPGLGWSVAFAAKTAAAHDAFPGAGPRCRRDAIRLRGSARARDLCQPKHAYMARRRSTVLEAAFRGAASPQSGKFAARTLHVRARFTGDDGTGAEIEGDPEPGAPGGSDDQKGRDQSRRDDQNQAPLVSALHLAAAKVKAPFFFPGHQMGRAFPMAGDGRITRAQQPYGNGEGAARQPRGEDGQLLGGRVRVCMCMWPGVATSGAAKEP